MTIARGISKIVTIAKESVWSEPVDGASPTAKELRRVTASFNLTKDTYESQEIRRDYQVADMRHGIRGVDGSLNGELAPGSYSELMGSVLSKDFEAVGAPVTLAGATITVVGNLITIVDTSPVAVGVGSIVKVSAATEADNNDAVLLIASNVGMTVTAVALTDADFLPETASTMVLTPQGKITFAPETNQTDDSYTVEEWYSDIGQSEVNVGVKVGSMAVSLPTTGLVTVDFSFMGRNVLPAGATQHFTNAQPAGTDGIFAAVSGAIVVDGKPIGLITSMDFNVDRALEAANVVGTDLNAAVFPGRIRANGNLSVYFQDNEFRNYFDKEMEISIVVALKTSGASDLEAMSFVFPRVKLGSSTKNDGESGIIQDCSFVALKNEKNLNLPRTTMQIIDTAA